MKIGQAIQELNRSESEAFRIINSIVDRIGKPSEVFNKYSKLNNNKSFWKDAYKRLKITGFRPGKSKNIILTKILQGIKNNNKTCIRLFWRLYANCVVDFIINEHSNFNQLLLDKEMEGDAESTDDVVKAIMKFIALYEVGTEQIEELYEVWWFERTSNLYDILSDQELSLEIVREIVLKSERKLSREIESLDKNISKLGSTIKDSTHIEQYVKEVNNLKEYYESLKEDFDIESAQIEKRFVEIIDGKIAVIEHKIEKEDPAGGSNKDDHALEDKISINEKNISRINNKIEALTKEKKHKEKARKKDRKIFNNNIPIKENLYKVFDDYNFGDNNSKLLLSILNSFNCFYVESDILFRAVAQDLISSGKIKEIIANPTMIDLSQINNKGLEEFDIIYIKNINSCFIEGSVIPILQRANSLVDKDFPKVFLLQDDELNPSITAKIKSHTLDLSYEWISEIKNLNITEPIKDVNLSNIEEVTSHHREMLRILENSGVKINQQIFERFVRLFHLFSFSSDERQSMMLSAQGVVFPYIRSSYGDSKAQVVIEILNGIA